MWPRKKKSTGQVQNNPWMYLQPKAIKGRGKKGLKEGGDVQEDIQLEKEQRSMWVLRGSGWGGMS